MNDSPHIDQRLLRGAKQVVSRLRQSGHDAYLVGGTVRDQILGRAVKDYDIATSATPDEVVGLFRRTVSVGAQFGVIIVLNRDGEYEVATFRAESSYSDGRRPDSIRFVSAREDVFRRDFTINGLLQDPETGEIRDFVGGRQDLEARVIRAIGNAQERFEEDYLRLHRAIRFAVTLGFELEADTRKAIVALAPRASEVSVERTVTELSRMFLEGNPKQALDLLVQTGLLQALLPEVHPVAQTASNILANLGSQPFPVILAVLLREASPATGRALCERLKMTRADRDQLCTLLRARAQLATLDSRAARIRFVRTPFFPVFAAWIMAERQAENQSDGALPALQALRKGLRPEEMHPVKHLTGNDLKAMGIPPGPLYKQLLTALEDAQLEGEVHSRQEAEEWIHHQHSAQTNEND